MNERIGVLLFALVSMGIIGAVIFTFACRLLAMPSIMTRVGY